MSCFLSPGFQFNREKCRFPFHQIKVLGHVVSVVGVSPHLDKIRPVTDFPVPPCMKYLCFFIGLCFAFRRFARNFAGIGAPLTALLGKDNVFHWSADCSRAYSQLTAILISSPVFRHYSPYALENIYTDASGVGIGAILPQRCNNDPMEDAVFYGSRTLNKAEQNYTLTVK